MTRLLSSQAVAARRTVWPAVAAALVVLATVAWALAGSARAAFPGANGRIVFASQRQDSQYEIYSMKADGTDRRRIELGENPKYSRGGTRIAFIREHDVWVMNFDGTGQRNLTNDAAFEINPSWSPDDKQIAFAKRDGRAFDIYVVSTEGSQPAKNLTRSANADDRGPSWSPNGKWIAYERDGQIRVMSADGKTSRALTSKGTNVSPAWSPDGKRIAFAAKIGDAGNWEIYAMSAEGANVKALTSHPDIDLDPAWSPDGKFIAFTSTRAKSYDIHVMNADGSNVIQLVQGAAEDTTSDWQSVDKDPVATGVVQLKADKCFGEVGTGFIVGPTLVVTADHVVAERGRAARKIELRNGTKKVGTATVIGRDQLSDVALLRTSRRIGGHVFRFAVSAPRKNDDIVVHGFPQGADRVARSGEIESSRQTTVGDDNVRRSGLIQIAVAATEGMSGGPLVRAPSDENGEAGHVLGLVIQIRERGNIAFAVPAPAVEAKIARWSKSPTHVPTVRC